MRTKNGMIYLLSGVLSIGLITGCSGNNSGNNTNNQEPVQTTAAPGTEEVKIENFNAEGFPIVTTPIKLNMMGLTHPILSEWEDNLFFKRMEEKTNISFEYNTALPANWAEKKNIMFAGNDLPDVFFKASLSPEEEMRYGEQGTLIPLEELIDKYAPNIKKMFEERPDIKKSITLPNGHIVALPKVLPADTIFMMYVNQMWLDALKLEKPTTPEELYNVLKAMKEGDPNGNGKQDEIPLSFSVEGNAVGYNQNIRLLMGNWGLLPNAYSGVYINEENKVEFAFMQPEYKEFLKFMKKLYDEQLLDNEVFVQNEEQVKAKGTGTDNQLGIVVTASPLIYVGAERHYDYTALPPMKTADGKQVWLQDPGIQRGKFAITSANPNPEAMIRWVDYLYGEEGRRLVWMGVEGEDYKVNDDGTWNWILAEGQAATDKRGIATIQPGGSEVGGPPEFWTKINDKLERHLIDNRNQVNPFGVTEYPLIYLEDAKQKQVNAVQTDISGFVSQKMAQFIIGRESIDESWESYVQTLNQMGIDSLIEIYDEAFQQYSSN
ncbi:extracellular solute-binding protein [Paenibacillus sp. strain BS8-2]